MQELEDRIPNTKGYLGCYECNSMNNQQLYVIVSKYCPYAHSVRYYTVLEARVYY